MTLLETTLLDENGLNIAAFEPLLAAALGNRKGEEGGKVLAEAILHAHGRVQLRDWLYCLAKAPGTKVRKHLIDRMGQSPEAFIRGIEGGLDDDESSGPPLTKLTKETVTPAIDRMLTAAARLRSEYGLRTITDGILTMALMQEADHDLKRLLARWATEDVMKRFEADLRPQRDVAVFDHQGRLITSAFDTSGRAFCRRLAEDAASLGAKQITSRHFLYTLLGNETGALAAALSVRGIDVKKDLHAMLSRELAKPGRKRTESFALRYTAPRTGNPDAGAETVDTVFRAVAQVLEQAGANAQRRNARGITEFDISCAFVKLESTELLRLFSGRDGVDLGWLNDYLEMSDPEEEEEDTPTSRFSIGQIEENMKNRICGQDAAITRVLPWIKRLRFGFPREGRPAAVFLFMGPTGTGKTQLAKELARYVFGDEDKIIFLEMGQFKTRESLTGFIGAPPGYVGYGEGKLTNGLRDQPECVVLFDEIEKADSQVFDALLRFADEGMISDPAGPVRDGRKCIIVMTTNAGQTWLRTHPEAKDSAGLADTYLAEAKAELAQRQLRPEFLGRVDERIVFLPLGPDTCRRIVDGVLQRELENFKKLKEITIEVSDEVRNFIAERAYARQDEEGARGVPRTINDLVITRVIDLLAQLAEQGRSPSRLFVSYNFDGVIVEPERKGLPAD